MLVIATGTTLGVRQMVETARTLNPDIEIVVRTHSEEETDLLRNEHVGTVFFGEEELARGMSMYVLNRFDRAPAGG
jgi:CPA2 family monovalent cation:H+ antiporter-2